MSTPKDRLFEVYQAYRIAKSQRAADWRDAKTMKEADQIQANVEKLETAYLLAAVSELDANGEAVEAAFKSAKEARKVVEKAYKDAKALADRIRAVSSSTKAVASLVKKASSKNS